MSDAYADWPVEHLVYRGRRWGSNKVLAHTFATLDQEEVIWLAGAPQWAEIGRTYAIKAKDGRYALHTATPEGPDQLPAPGPTELEWRVADRAAYLAHQGHLARKRNSKMSKDFQQLTLEDLRNLYLKTSPAQRAGLITAILREVGI